MVAERDAVDAGRKEILRVRGRQAVSLRRVLAVRHDEIQAPFLAQRGQAPRDRLPAGPAHDVSKKQDAHHEGRRLARLHDPDDLVLGYHDVQSLIA